jgi:hypothetical protein
MVEDEMLRRARLVKATAEAIAPRGDPLTDRHAGLYAASVLVTSTKNGGVRQDRAVAYATNVAPYARWVEYSNSQGGPAHHVMLRAAVAGGG